MIVKDPKKANYIIRWVYLLFIIGYVISWVGAYKAVKPLKDYNDLVIKYISTSVNENNDSFDSFVEAKKVIDRDVDLKINSIKKDVKETFESADKQKLIIELSDGTDLIKTTLYESVEKDLDKQIVIDNQEDIQEIVDTQSEYPIVGKYFSLLSSGKLVQSILLFLTFPAFSPLIIAILVKVLITRIYVKSKHNIPNEVYMDRIPSIYTTNLILAIFSLMAFYSEVYIGLAVAIYAHGLFIYQMYQGLRLKPIKNN